MDIQIIFIYCLCDEILKANRHSDDPQCKKSYFWGIKVHMVVTAEGLPVEFIFTPGSTADIKALREFELDLPEGSYLFGDKAYTDYGFEDLLKEINISLIPERKRNSRKQHNQSLCFIQKSRRKRVETVFSGITQLMPRSIHATTGKGFLLKVLLFIVSYTTSMCCK